MGKWQQHSVAGHPCDLFLPDSQNLHGYVIIYLHGVHLQKLNDKPDFVRQFEQHGLPVVAPITQRSWWTDRLCDEFDSSLSAEQYLIENVLPWIEQQFGSRSPRIGLLGTSMGGQGALRFAYKYPDIFPAVAAISPAIDYQCRFNNGDEIIRAMYSTEEAVRQDTATLHVHPLHWPRHQFFSCDPVDSTWFDSSDRLRMKLSSLGIPYECDLETSHGGHGFKYYNYMAERAIQFLVESLERERMRII